ncbi:hypothetical protein [Priestia megaterium]|uniref:hypothetical protein n=1 Tax=Priestia megaterium TaxID=1404 RepID=UPI00188FF9D7|nr:hypothetical protein [Priestia megaterium]
MNIVKLKAQEIIHYYGSDFEDFETETREVEINLEEIELGELETDKALSKNIIKTSKMLIELTDENTRYVTDNLVRRPTFEVNGGIKLALKKGARVKEAKLFNLFFRFYNRKFDGYNTKALMVRPRNINEEWIILLPEDTEKAIEEEKGIFREYIEKLVFQGSLDTDFQNMVVEGYKFLTPNERCAQTLMHEFGHILQWRMYDYLDIKGETEQEFIANQYIWFLSSSYLLNVSKRVPNFETLSPEDKVYFSKECLVEDYRIYLNWKYFSDKIILPSKYAYRGDFADSKLMWEGLSIMEQMLKPAIEGKVGMRQMKKASSEKEYSLKDIKNQLDSLEYKADWIPGTSKLSEQHILADLESLGLNIKSEKRAYTTV